nr:basic proline-rich protein-like [Aegilops tauschii subsp. strangulata]
MASSGSGDSPAAAVAPGTLACPDLSTAPSPPPPLPVSPPPAPAVVPLPPSPAPARFRWADLAEDDADSPPPPLQPLCAARLSRPYPATRRAASPCVAGSSASPVRGYAAASRRPLHSAPAPGPQGSTLRGASARHRRQRSWGVVGRSEVGRARASWRRFPAGSTPSPAPPPPMVRRADDLAAPIVRSSPFCPFIATFGSSSLCFQSLQHFSRPWPALAAPGIWPPYGLPHASTPLPAATSSQVFASPSAPPAASSQPPAPPPCALPPPPPPSPLPSVRPAMPREWDDGEARHKRRYDDRPRPSPDAVRREEELRWELRELRDGHREDRRSPGRSDRRGRSRSPSPARVTAAPHRLRALPASCPLDPKPFRLPPRPGNTSLLTQLPRLLRLPRPLRVVLRPVATKARTRRRSAAVRAAASWLLPLRLPRALRPPRGWCPVSPALRASIAVWQAILKSTASTHSATTSARTRATPPFYARIVLCRLSS